MTWPTSPGLGIDIRDVSHQWSDTLALSHVDLDITPGSFVAVVGASGCGKSTLLRLVAGLDHPTGGSIRLRSGPTSRTDDASAAPARPAEQITPDQLRRRQQVGWLAQRPALMPWLSVRENIALATSITAGTTDGRDPDALIDLVGLAGFADALPAALSGGMQQRASLARTLALAAPLWLMDEPFAALDELTREGLADDLVQIWQQFGPTVLWVTHNLTEAVALADRIIVMSPRPGTIVGDVSVDLPRPRDVTQPASQDIVRGVRHLLKMDAMDAATTSTVSRDRVGASR